MPFGATAEIEIDRPIATVAAFAADPANAPRWYNAIDSVRWVTGDRVTVGAEVEFVTRSVGRRSTHVHQIVELEAERRLTMRTTTGPSPMSTRYTWSAVDENRTVMTLRTTGGPTGAAAVASPLLSLAVRRAHRKDLRKLKRLLEQGGPEPH